jgi:2-dehydropantoate 2-reductase
VLKFPPHVFEGFHEDLYLGRLTQIPTPALDAALALVAQRGKVAGMHGIDPPVEAKTPVFA